VAWPRKKPNTVFFRGKREAIAPYFSHDFFQPAEKGARKLPPPKIWLAQKLCFVRIVPVVFWAISRLLTPFFYMNKNAAPEAIGHPRPT